MLLVTLRFIAQTAIGLRFHSVSRQGREPELCCEGGEVGFVQRFAEESAKVSSRHEPSQWFSNGLTMV